MTVLNREKKVLAKIAIDDEVTKCDEIIKALLEETMKSIALLPQEYKLNNENVDFSTPEKKIKFKKDYRLLERKLRIWEALDIINTALPRQLDDVYKWTYQQQQDSFESHFKLIYYVMNTIKTERTGMERVIDFIKSALNRMIYLLSATTHPGFFATTTQPLQDGVVYLRKLSRLLDEIASYDKPDALQFVESDEQPIESDSDAELQEASTPSHH